MKTFCETWIRNFDDEEGPVRDRHMMNSNVLQDLITLSCGIVCAVEEAAKLMLANFSETFGKHDLTDQRKYLFIHLRQFTQDGLESMFGHLRQSCGGTQNPNLAAVRYWLPKEILTEKGKAKSGRKRKQGRKSLKDTENILNKSE